MRKKNGIKKEELLRVGIDPSLKGAGSFFQRDDEVAGCSASQDGLEILPVKEAEKRYGWIEEFSWRLISPESDEVTEEVFRRCEGGYFIRVFEGARLRLPVQACLYVGREGEVQRLHNIIVLEENSEAVILTGCLSGEGVESARHLSVTEFYIKSGARVTYSMIHSWGREVSAFSRSASLVERGGRFVSTYVSMDDVKRVDMYPTCILGGEGASSEMSSVVYARKGSFIDVGGRVILRASGTSSEVISRAVSSGGEVISRGHLLAESPGCRGHLECRGLITEGGGRIHAIPELESRVSDVDLSHEAAVGRIAKEEIEYLMARGIDEESATSLIVKGFLLSDIEGLPELIKKRIGFLLEKTKEGA